MARHRILVPLPWVLLSIALLPGAPPSSHPDVPRPQAVAAADLDGDGVPELIAAYASGGAGRVVTFRKPFLEPTSIDSLDTAPDFVAAGDLDGDSLTDVAIGTRGATYFTVL